MRASQTVSQSDR